MPMISLVIWGAAVALYLAFLGWHENWRGKLTEAEIAHFTALVEGNEDTSDAQKKVMLDFMAGDTGREFFMVNLLTFPDGKIPHPDTGKPVSGAALLQDYYRPFAGMILRNAGYPAQTGRVKGGEVEIWGTAAEQGWQVVGLMRYRSRRDLLKAATDPSFSGIHVHKRAALAATFAVPVESDGGAFVSPRLWVGLLLGTLAGLVQLAVMIFRSPNVG